METTKRRNYLDTSIKMTDSYRVNCELKLANIFSNVSIVSIRRIMSLPTINNHFTPCFANLQKLVDSKSDTITFIKTKRTGKKSNQISPEFEEEYADFVVKQDHDFATKLNEEEYEEEGQGIECGCCLESRSFESFTQCNGGHLICIECVRTHVEEKVFGDRDFDFHCMDYQSNCQEKFPEAAIEKALSKDSFQRYQVDNLMNELKEAGLEVTKCLHCDYAYCMEPEDTVFSCRLCKKQTCILCEQTAHPNQPCPKKETIAEESKRKAMEEELTKARLRKCPCGTEFIKTEGCNKIICSKCTTTMCYVCQATKIDYNHFCGCPDRGTAKSSKDCTKCKKCTLFYTNTEKIDEDDVEATKKRKLAEASITSIDLTEDDQPVINKKARVVK
jgi:TRIAD3 protein (E3 ubiquitin-protein ligase RNF216)